MMFSTAPISYSRIRYPSSIDFSPMMRGLRYLPGESPPGRRFCLHHPQVAATQARRPRRRKGSPHPNPPRLRLSGCRPFPHAGRALRHGRTVRHEAACPVAPPPPPTFNPPAPVTSQAEIRRPKRRPGKTRPYSKWAVTRSS